MNIVQDPPSNPFISKEKPGEIKSSALKRHKCLSRVLAFQIDRFLFVSQGCISVTLTKDSVAIAKLTIKFWNELIYSSVFSPTVTKGAL